MRIDGVGQVIVRLDVRHDAAGLTDIVARLKRVAAPAELPIAIARPSGLVVDTLVEAGYPVISIHPNVVKACRPRYRAAGGKSDPGDAFMLADILRTDGHRFRPLVPVSDDIRALRALVRGRDDLVAQRVALANQLRNLLEGFWPGAVAIFAAIDSPIALAFIGRYPTPDSASRLGEKRLACFMAQHAYCGRRSPADLLARLRAAPTGLAGDAEADAKGELAAALVAILERLVCEIAKLSSRIEHAVVQLPDGKIVMSFRAQAAFAPPRSSLSSATCASASRPSTNLLAEAGVCPVTHASGKSRGVVFRWACNKNLRLALTCFADNSRHASAWAAAVYRKARDRGCKHPHAVRILARAWLRVLWRAWRDKALYDPQQHRAAIKITA